ncbi:MAG: carboxylating nicotinate-nucleotide diphosphorylase [Gammaproteobacteria bacterium]|nr:carboxylating nicotinate-nucleotide diphosphorylase [Gammaproteobacteria bacterium]
MDNLQNDIKETIRIALAEDLGDGDITSELIPASKTIEAIVLSREEAVICGVDWVNEVFAQIDSNVSIVWSVEEGILVNAGTELLKLRGSARSILSGERTALNFLQTLSATASQTRYFIDLLAETSVTLLDTRKTLPGLRSAQKYAVRIGGGTNHRLGLFDAFLIKENHIDACGGIPKAIAAARALHPEKTVEIEVQNLPEFMHAIEAEPDIIMLDNFSIDSMKEAVVLNQGRCKIEASGGIQQDQLVNIAKTGVDYISIGGLTKNCQAIDLTMLVL